MPDLNPTAKPVSLAMLAAEATARQDDGDEIALGCECADPALQIERWSQETVAPVAIRDPR